MQNCSRVQIILCFCLFSFSNLFSSQIEKDLYFLPGEKKPHAIRYYRYDPSGNISRIIENIDGEDKITLRYTYDKNSLITAEEYNGRQRIAYSLFTYRPSSPFPISRSIYDNDEKLKATYRFFYHNGLLTKIEEYQSDGEFFGKRSFQYENNLLIKETEEDEKGNLLMQKEYKYEKKNGKFRIQRICFYFRDHLIRIIERKYDENSGGTFSPFSFPANFWDF